MKSLTVRAAVLTASPMQLRARHEYVPKDLSKDGMIVMMVKMMEVMKMMMELMEMMEMLQMLEMMIVMLTNLLPLS